MDVEAVCSIEKLVVGMQSRDTSEYDTVIRGGLEDEMRSFSLVSFKLPQAKLFLSTQW
jgi:hypothetical protein